MSTQPRERVEFPVADAQTAIRLASAFASKGYTIFRGQSADWALSPTIHRPGTDKQVATERIRLFADWVHRQPELRELHDNFDAITAVAQHYGFMTPFLDFTREPTVAAHFALGENHTSPTGTSVIACINPEHAEEAWRPYNQQRLDQGKPPLLRIVDIDVTNLWRLKAQRGLFLDVHVDDELFTRITPIVFILFPVSSGAVLTPSREIYPSNMSPLEALLEKFFAEEKARIRLDKKVRQMENAGANIASEWERANTNLSRFFVGANFPTEDPSWIGIDNSPWLSSLRSDLDDEFGYPDVILNIDPQQPTSRIWQVMRASILSQTDRWRRRGIVKWQVRFRTPAAGGRRSDISAALSHMYDGMRWLPYTDEQIAQSLATYLCLVVRQDEQEQHWGHLVAIELAAELVTSRCLVGWLPLRQAFRSDVQQHLTEESRQTLSAIGYDKLVDMLPYPRKLFDFEKLVDLFATQIIPSQCICSCDVSAVVFNPAKLDILTLAVSLSGRLP